MTGWLITLAVLALFLLLKVGVYFHWDNQETVLKIRIGLFRFSLSTEEKKPKKKKEKKPEKQPASPAQQKEKNADKTNLKKWIKALLAHWADLFSLLGKILKSPTLDLLRLYIAVAGEDTELRYGKFCAGLSAGLPVLHNTFRVKKQDIQIACRYETPKTQIMAEAEATIRIYEVFALVGSVLGLLVKIFLTKKRNDKAVQINETSSS